MKEKIRLALIAKYKNLGFSDKAIEGVLGYLETTVTAEDQIDGAVNGIEGMLKAFQAEADRRATEAAEKAKKPVPDPAKPEGGDPAKPNEPAKVPDDVPAWAKTLLDQNKALADKIAAIEQGKSTDTRKSQLEDTLKDSVDAFKNSTLKAFNRMQFKDDEEFKTYLEEVKTDSAAFVQTEANKGLGGQGKPMVPAGDPSKAATKEEVASVISNIM